MKKALWIGMLAAMVMALALGAAPAMAKTYRVSIGGGPTGGTFQYFANAMSVYVPKVFPDIKMSAEGSGGSAENLKRINAGDFDFGISYAGDIYLGAIGQLPKDDKKYTKVRVMGYLYGAPAQLVVKKAAGIKSAKDLAGKKIAVGNAGSGAALSAERFFKHLGIWDKIQPQFLGYSAAASAFKDGKIDAFWVLVGYPNASIIEAATQEEVALVNVGLDAEASGFYKAYPFYAPATIPANTYSGQTEPVKSFQDSALLVCSSGLDEAMVYNIMKAVWSKDGLDYMVKAHKAARSMTIENGYTGASRPLAAGAAKFWAEQGKKIPDDLKPVK
ncbi:MAG: TAXI family TRAP transporter solute-binding subunit [Pseudomonadota bacterium]